jgi:phosphatidylserine/phosphatidylglycerophosphate/cardiolipin synthase-like enzyme
MKLSEYAIQELVPYVTGTGTLGLYRKGKDLVELFNQYGLRDVYDSNHGGLPKLTENGEDMNTSRSTYTRDRLRKLSDKPEVWDLLSEVIQESDNPNQCVEEINQIISPEGVSFGLVNGKYVVQGITITRNQEIKNNAYFEGIQNKILKELDAAQVSITLAMAWFTNTRLLEKLREKQKEGLHIEIVIYDDGTNAKYGVDLTGFNYMKVRSDRGGIMHDKFCVIDNQVVITGSYNWTAKAETKNNENVTIERCPQLATKYSVEFRKLRNQGEKL